VYQSEKLAYSRELEVPYPSVSSKNNFTAVLVSACTIVIIGDRSMISGDKSSGGHRQQSRMRRNMQLKSTMNLNSTFMFLVFGLCCGGMIAMFQVGRMYSPFLRTLLLHRMQGSQTPTTPDASVPASELLEDDNISDPPKRRQPLNASWVDLMDDVDEMTCRNDSATCDATSTLAPPSPSDNSWPRKRFHEMLVHPLLLNLNPQPASVVVSMLWEEDPTSENLHVEIASLLAEISRHESVEKVYIVVEGSIATTSCYTALSAIHLTRVISFQCMHIEKLERNTSVSVDAILLPTWPKDEAMEEEYEDEMQFWYDRLASHGALVVILGTTYPIQHIQGRRSIIHDRWPIIDQLSSVFPRIIDYDIPASYYYQGINHPLLSSQFPVNLAVAFKSPDGMAQWRKNEAHYNLAMREQMTEDAVEDLVVFDSAVMIQIQHPPSHSSWYYCDGYRKASDCDFHGYDPEYPNVPLTDLYVSKSKAGENAGRGVFANVDIQPDSNIGLETTTQSIHFEWTTTELHRHMVEEVPEYEFGKARIVNVYAEAYGYASSP
jgi:hypothetical protein